MSVINACIESTISIIVFLLNLSENTPAMGIHIVEIRIVINEATARIIALPVTIVNHHINTK